MAKYSDLCTVIVSVCLLMLLKQKQHRRRSQNGIFFFNPAPGRLKCTAPTFPSTRVCEVDPFYLIFPVRCSSDLCQTMVSSSQRTEDWCELSVFFKLLDVWCFRFMKMFTGNWFYSICGEGGQLLCNARFVKLPLLNYFKFAPPVKEIAPVPSLQFLTSPVNHCVIAFNTFKLLDCWALFNYLWRAICKL